MTHSEIVIVGGGGAGHAMAEELHRRDAGVALTLVCAEPRLRNDPRWYAARGVRVRLGVRASALWTAARRVRLDDGEVLAYEHAVLCTGSRTPPLAGAYALRTPEDRDAVHAAAARVRRAIVVGGGRRGVEAARAIAVLGCAVAIVEPPSRVRAIARDEDGDAEGVVLDTGERLPAELVVSVVTCPETALARSAGIAVQHAIVVDAQMRTSAAGVLAVGGCTAHEASRKDQARIAAEALLGRLPAAGATPAAAATAAAVARPGQPAAAPAVAAAA